MEGSWERTTSFSWIIADPTRPVRHISQDFTVSRVRCWLTLQYRGSHGKYLFRLHKATDERIKSRIMIHLLNRFGNVGETRYVVDTEVDTGSSWIYDDDVDTACPEFRKENVLRFLIVLPKEPKMKAKDSVTQTSCSIPVGFDMSCMENLSEDLDRLMVQGPDPDVEFRCGGLSVRAHGAVISARSQVIASMLSSDMLEGRTRTIVIPDMTPVVFRHFMRYLYTGRLPELTFEVALDLYESADQYAVLGLARRCSRYLAEHLSDQNACDLLVVADAHSDEGFVEEVVDFMVEKVLPWTSDRWPSFRDEHRRLAKKVLNRLNNFTQT